MTAMSKAGAVAPQQNLCLIPPSLELCRRVWALLLDTSCASEKDYGIGRVPQVSIIPTNDYMHMCCCCGSFDSPVASSDWRTAWGCLYRVKFYRWSCALCHKSSWWCLENALLQRWNSSWCRRTQWLQGCDESQHSPVFKLTQSGVDLPWGTVLQYTSWVQFHRTETKLYMDSEYLYSTQVVQRRILPCLEAETAICCSNLQISFDKILHELVDLCCLFRTSQHKMGLPLHNLWLDVLTLQACPLSAQCRLQKLLA